MAVRRGLIFLLLQALATEKIATSNPDIWAQKLPFIR